MWGLSGAQGIAQGSWRRGKEWQRGRREWWEALNLEGSRELSVQASKQGVVGSGLLSERQSTGPDWRMPITREGESQVAITSTYSEAALKAQGRAQWGLFAPHTY